MESSRPHKEGKGSSRIDQPKDSGDVIIQVPGISLGMRGIPPAQRGQVHKFVAQTVLNVYRKYYPECREEPYESPSGGLFYKYPRLANSMYRDNAAGGDQEKEYFHGGDLVAYRKALRCLYPTKAIECIDIEPRGYKRPKMNAAEAALLKKVM